MKMPIGTFEPRDLAVIICSEYDIDIMRNFNYPHSDEAIYARAVSFFNENESVVLQLALITIMHFYELSILQKSDIDEEAGDLSYEETFNSQLTRLHEDYNKLIEMYDFLKIPQNEEF